MPSFAKAPPVIDFAQFYGTDAKARQEVVDQVREACLDKGFFQITNHNVPAELQEKVFEQSKKFFDLPKDKKLEYDRTKNHYNRGYEYFGSQIFEEGCKPDLKEGFYLGRDLAEDHPFVKSKAFNCGPNIYPDESSGIEDPAEFRKVMDEYFDFVYGLARQILRVLALTLDLNEDWFEEFADDAITITRLLHYPSQPVDADGLARGIGAHTDFGAVTLLMQGEVSGLQVWDRETDSWVDVAPIKNAYVVNLGNLMMRWTNDRYKSNLHRVINKSGKERYSVPFFFTGKPGFIVKCLPGCAEDGEEKYSPISTTDYVQSKYVESYGKATKYKEQLNRHKTAA